MSYWVEYRKNCKCKQLIRYTYNNQVTNSIWAKIIIVIVTNWLKAFAKQLKSIVYFKFSL